MFLIFLTRMSSVRHQPRRAARDGKDDFTPFFQDDDELSDFELELKAVDLRKFQVPFGGLKDQNELTRVHIDHAVTIDLNAAQKKDCPAVLDWKEHGGYGYYLPHLLASQPVKLAQYKQDGVIVVSVRY